VFIVFFSNNYSGFIAKNLEKHKLASGSNDKKAIGDEIEEIHKEYSF